MDLIRSTIYILPPVLVLSNVYNKATVNYDLWFENNGTHRDTQYQNTSKKNHAGQPWLHRYSGRQPENLIVL